MNKSNPFVGSSLNKSEFLPGNSGLGGIALKPYEPYSEPPKAGRWVIGGNFHYHMDKKPNWFHRTMTRLFFGIEWKDGMYP